MKIQKIIFTILILKTLHISADDIDQEFHCMSFVKDVLEYFKFIPKEENIYSRINNVNAYENEKEAIENLSYIVKNEQIKDFSRFLAAQRLIEINPEEGMKALIYLEENFFIDSFWKKSTKTKIAFIGKNQESENKNLKNIDYLMNIHEAPQMRESMVDTLLEGISNKQLSLHVRLSMQKSLDRFQGYKNEKIQALTAIIQDSDFPYFIRFQSLERLAKDYQNKLSITTIGLIKDSINESWGTIQSEAANILNKMIDDKKEKNKRKKNKKEKRQNKF